MEVLLELLKKVKDLDNKNSSYLVRIKDLQKGDDKHMKMINYLEKENVFYRAKEKFFMYALLFSWF